MEHPRVFHFEKKNFLPQHFYKAIFAVVLRNNNDFSIIRGLGSAYSTSRLKPRKGIKCHGFFTHYLYIENFEMFQLYIEYVKNGHILGPLIIINLIPFVHVSSQNVGEIIIEIIPFFHVSSQNVIFQNFEVQAAHIRPEG